MFIFEVSWSNHLINGWRVSGYVIYDSFQQNVCSIRYALHGLIKYLSQTLKVDISVKVSFHSCQLKTAQNKVDLMTMFTMTVHAISIMTNGMFLHMVSKWCARLFRYLTCVESTLKSNNVLSTSVQSLQVILESVCWTTYARTVSLI